MLVNATTEMFMKCLNMLNIFEPINHVDPSFIFHSLILCAGKKLVISY